MYKTVSKSAFNIKGEKPADTLTRLHCSSVCKSLRTKFFLDHAMWKPSNKMSCTRYGESPIMYEQKYIFRKVMREDDIDRKRDLLGMCK